MFPFELAIEHKHTDHVPCHPHRQPIFDPVAIHDQIYNKKNHLVQHTESQASENQEESEKGEMRDALWEAKSLLQPKIADLVKKRIFFIEQKVYLGTNENPNSVYVARLRSEISFNPILEENLAHLFEGIHSSVENELVEAVYDVKIPPQEPTADRSPIKRIQSQRKTIQKKLAEMKKEIEKEPVELDEKKASEGAQELILKMQAEKEEKERKRKKREERQRELEVRSESDKKQFNEQMANQKKAAVKLRYQASRLQKQKELEKKKQEQAKFKQFLGEYRKRKPLYQSIQEEFEMKKSDEERVKIEMALQRIKEAKQSVSKEEILLHEEKLKAYKRKHEADRMTIQSEHIPLQKEYFRGRFHSLIANENCDLPDPILEDVKKIRKRQEFGRKIKKEFPPKIDEAKRLQLYEAIQKQSIVKVPVIEEGKGKKQGNLNLLYLHERVRQFGRKEKPNEPPQIVVHHDYLRERRRMSHSIDIPRQTELDVEWTERQAIKHDVNAMRREQLARVRDFDLQKHMAEMSRINQEYVQAAEMKLALIAHFKKNQEYKEQSRGEQKEQSRGEQSMNSEI